MTANPEPYRQLSVRRLGAGDPTLVLIHGLGATGAVWDPVIDALAGNWPGGIVVPDLRGHGRSPWAGNYSIGVLAADVAEVVGAAKELVVVAHSLGGVVGLALASGWFGVDVTAVVALSVKVTWTAHDLERAAAATRRTVTWFDSHQEAAARYLRVAGLDHLTGPEAPDPHSGVAVQDGRYRLAQDPATAGAGQPDMAGLLAAARCPVVLGCGSRDPMVSTAELGRFHDQPITFDDAGHNVHLEAAKAVADLILSTHATVRFPGDQDDPTSTTTTGHRSAHRR